VVNTTDTLQGGTELYPRHIDRHGHGPGHTINTSSIVEEDLSYIDDPDPVIGQVIPAENYFAVIVYEGEYRAVPLRRFTVYDNGTLFGVTAAEDGEVDLESSVDEVEGFVGIVHGEGVGSMSREELEELLDSTRVQEEG
jgi:hypothetical protein